MPQSIGVSVFGSALALLCIVVVLVVVVVVRVRRRGAPFPPPSPETTVHQIWIHDGWSMADGLEALPAKYRAAVGSWRARYRHNHCVHDRASCRETVRAHFPSLLDVYDRMRMDVERADMARYAILWAYGGFYTDMDTTMLRPIDAFVDDTTLHVSVEFAGTNSEPDGLVQYAFGSPPRHPVLRDMLEEVGRRAVDPRRRSMRPDERVFWTTGPAVFSHVVHRYRATNPTTVTIHRLGTFGAYKHNPPHAHIWHHFDGSWKEAWGDAYTYW